MKHLPSLTAALALTLSLGCSPPSAPEAVNPAPPASPAPPVSVAPPASAAPPAPSLSASAAAAPSAAASVQTSSLPRMEQKRRYVGFKSGLAYPERGTKARLPEGLTLARAVHTAAPVHYLVARRGDDLVLLLLDKAGVVSDSLEIFGAAAELDLVPGCDAAGGADVDVSLIPRACKGPITALRAWNGGAGKLEAAAARVTCVCESP